MGVKPVEKYELSKVLLDVKSKLINDNQCSCGCSGSASSAYHNCNCGTQNNVFFRS